MGNSVLTAKQKSAIRRLIAAKSDREIARLLRQTHRLLNLHERPRSCISLRDRWLDYELQLLGRMRDEELAQFLRRSPAAVAAKRESLGIAIFAPRRTTWSARDQICGSTETAFLGDPAMLGGPAGVDEGGSPDAGNRARPTGGQKARPQRVEC